MKLTSNFGKLTVFFILPLIMFFLTAPIYSSPIDGSKLTQKAKNVIAGYYEEPFRVSADDNGVVTVTGNVNTLFDKLRIAELIENIEGVQKVNNNITILNDITADDIIKANIEQEMQINDAILEPEKIIVEVKNGVVNLSGTVSYLREKLMAETIASWQDGVNDMVCNISILPSAKVVSDENITELINDIITKHFSLEKNITYTVSNGNVTLNGKAETLYAIKHLQEEIQRLVGVKSVKNNLVVKDSF